MAKTLCLRCGSRKLDDAKVVTPSAQLLSRKAKKVMGMLWSMGPAPDRAEVCLDCGFTSFFVNPESYRKQLEKDDLTKPKK